MRPIGGFVFDLMFVPLLGCLAGIADYRLSPILLAALPP
jgi:hypothetical protein